MRFNKIYCGDCLKLIKKLKPNSISTIITSPPYNKGSANRKIGKNDSWQNANIDYEICNDNLPELEYQKQQQEILENCIRVLKSDGSIFYNHKARIRNHRIITPFEWLDKFIIRQLIIWNRKNSPTLEPIRFLPNTELIFWITKEKKTPKFNRKYFKLGEVWEISPTVNRIHPAEFPEELVRRCILATTNKDDIVFDPYLGSGTTCIVAKRLRRKFIGFELNPNYVRKAKERIKLVNPERSINQMELKSFIEENKGVEKND